MSLDLQQRLFSACLDATPDVRERLLDECSDPAVREQVRELLRAHAEAPSLSLPDLGEFPRIAAPHQVGPFRLLERIGEGAMGEVYLAEQQMPVRRRVALKILKFGLATREVIARFELERQTLALLAHPNIARIYDAGTTPDGRPYFAMEYVPGIPITKYCDQQRLDVAARLSLCAQACSGVQHAHLRGIIHRDLKPSNILVAELDGVPVPKIIDFGIAKATTRGSDTHTRFGNMLGTPEYMSPEQAQLSPLDIDTRTDVYSLGIVLYELLAGSRPYPVTSDSYNPAVIINEIMMREAVRPSDIAAERTDESVARAQLRRLTPAALAARLRGDLDWIVLKAIEKERARRYDSPAALAADLQRHADDQPVLAGPPSTMYRLRKFVRRHRLVVGALSIAFVAAIVFGSAMWWFARQAAGERDRANEEAEVARNVTAFTAGLFELANPISTGSNETTARGLLDAGVRRLRAQSETQRPDVRASLLEAAANAYRGLGAYPESDRLLEEAIELRRRQIDKAPAAYAHALQSRAILRRDQGEFEDATALARDAAKILESTPDVPRADVQRAWLDLAEILRRRSELDEASTLATRALDESASLTPVRARALLVLGRVREAQGELAQSEQLLQQALDLQMQLDGPRGEMTIEAKNGLAGTFVTMGQPERAEPLLRTIVDDVRSVYGPEHGEVGIALNNLANALSDVPEKYAEAASVYLEAADILRRTKGPQHPEVGTTYNNLGALYLKTQEWTRADEAYQHAIAIRVAALGDAHPEVASSRNGRAMALAKLGRYDEAEALLRPSIATFTATLGAEHWRTANARRYLASVLAGQGKFDEAQREVDAACAILTKSLGADHPRTVAALQARSEIDAQRRASRVAK
jgi:non-specific serine/threonine protein kinase/serine/threonine-protein kinase